MSDAAAIGIAYGGNLRKPPPSRGLKINQKSRTEYGIVRESGAKLEPAAVRAPGCFRMLSCRRYLPLSPLALLMLGLSACDRHPAEIFSRLDPSPTMKIIELSPKAEGDRVVVQGKVLSIAPMVKQSAYEVQDESGVVWVLTNGKPPQRYAQVKVHGVVRSTNGERYIDQK
jgi:hypothetical protein